MLISEGSHVARPSKRRSLGKHVNPSLQFIAANHFALAACCAAGVGIWFFFCGVQLFAHKESSGRAPKVTISAAVAGLAAVAGKATGPRTLASPISGKPCYVYRASIWQLHESVAKKEWKNVAEETGHLTFLVEDETGRLLVEPGGAELDLRQNLSEEFLGPSVSSVQEADKPSNKSAVSEAVASFLARNGVALDRPTRVEEYCLQPEAQVVITGTIAKNSTFQMDSLASTSAASARTSRMATGDSPVPASKTGNPLRQQPEIIRLATGSTPQSTAQMSQQAKIAAALAKAGLAQPDMWATAEAGARGIASGTSGLPKPEQSKPNPTDATATPALAVTMTMSKGPDDSTFMISHHQPTPRISVGWKSVALVLAGSTLTTLGLYVLLFANLH
jgi:hypothetical protein